MASLVVHQDAFGLGICHPVACLITNLTVLPYARELDEDIARCLDTLRHHEDLILDRPEVAGFHDLTRALGYGQAQPAGHHRLRRFRELGFKSHNNLVDAYNLASIEYCSGIGMHDVGDGLSFDVHVFRARGGERIVPLYQRKSVPIPAGDLIYGSDRDSDDDRGPAVLAALGRKDVDSDAFKVTEKTRTVLLVALGNPRTSASYNRALCTRVVELVRRTCPAARGKVLDVAIQPNSTDDQMHAGPAERVIAAV